MDVSDFLRIFAEKNRFVYMKSKYCAAAACLTVALASSAMTLDDAWKLYNNADYERAAEAADSISAAQPKSSAAPYLAGLSYQALGKHDKAKSSLNSAKAKGSSDAAAVLASEAFNAYRVDQAEALINEYRKLLAKTKGAKPNDLVPYLESKLPIMRSMLDRVEDIVVVDSVNVDAEMFFQAYKLSPESGQICSGLELPEDFPASDPTTVYCSEDGKTMIWGADDPQTQLSDLYTSHLLNDGSWEAPQLVGDNLGLGGMANYPFMMPDGQTLYFAAANDESLGGYDIFITRDNGDGFLTPQNLGMPYNSPADDYLLAIDESTGVGWWATNRNGIEGMVTIYLFIPSDFRKNISIDDPALLDRARIGSIANTQRGEDFSEFLARVEAVKPAVSAEKIDFMLTLADGRVITSLDELSNQQAVEAMEEYLQYLEDFNFLKNDLENLRIQYAGGDTSVSSDILQLERRIEAARPRLLEQRNRVISLNK